MLIFSSGYSEIPKEGQARRLGVKYLGCWYEKNQFHCDLLPPRCWNKLRGCQNCGHQDVVEDSFYLEEGRKSRSGTASSAGKSYVLLIFEVLGVSILLVEILADLCFIFICN